MATAMALTAAQVEEFQKNGFLIVEHVLTPLGTLEWHGEDPRDATAAHGEARIAASLALIAAALDQSGC